MCKPNKKNRGHLDLKQDKRLQTNRKRFIGSNFDRNYQQRSFWTKREENNLIVKFQSTGTFKSRTVRILGR